MKPVDQLFPHDPENGIYGDCFRAVIASLLGVSAEEVPHFLHDNCDTTTFNSRISTYLKDFDLCYFECTVYDIKKWKELCRITRPIYHIITDKSPRFPDTYHSVIGCDGEIVHDPHPSKSGLPEVTKDRVFGFLIKLCNEDMQ